MTYDNTNRGLANALLQPEDSARVADALVNWLEGEDITGAVGGRLYELFWPLGSDVKKTWFVDVIEDACNRIVQEIASAARERK
jgi:hypothetical protein